ncbi:hypothetical protein COV88_02515 [Candidatus Saccharibacteria bacterium CG11_big_fil_rev_8_21_14_0_20_41_19]|nr:hypothetical protein [Candidatus Saccharibacteria bacterium]OIP86042.1 MAG: hypothetical protein AUK57_01880 [Candidatus Saccharibacteria bacterium CG2_30_41_52]PIQ70767.1 MAG: hypothetical protein COV88_02515 [Candidatus Saccharibacteria bacterium CG11_big_fil_rev_8_21_14_0_20_41_19]PIZ59249.1 MAG: hypothetical protein COY18_03930 [Candidatus Saccharibacteria bacterium CG_4_10_14_0_2_um_filter_41_11]PJC30038.1 MAG: hypothetical protein CO052_00250 [Candidatus Saccharibacteria bacterium CG_4
MKNFSFAHLLAPVVSTLKKLSLVIFIIVIAGGLVYAIMTISSILTQPPSDSSKKSTNSASIDQATVNRLNRYKTSDVNSTNQSLPSGRINPFSE